MDFDRLAELKDYTLARLEVFHDEFKSENTGESTFESWNARDTLGHLAWWVRFAGTKLEYMKSGRMHGGVANLEEFNRNTFNSYRNISMTVVYNELKSAMDYFSDMMKLYAADELPARDFPTGFGYELWRYMDLHLFVHHIMHILFYYLKKGNMEAFAGIAGGKGEDILEYGNMDVLLYRDYCSDSTMLERQFAKLKEYNDKTGKNKMVEEIIKINAGTGGNGKRRETWK